MTFLRPFPTYKKSIFQEIDFHNLFDMAESISPAAQQLQSKDKGKIKEWIEFAKDDLSACGILYEAEKYGLSLYHLQQTVEKLVKANAIFLGLKEERELYKFGHNPAEFFIELLKQPIVKKIMSTNPLKSLKMDPLKDKEMDMLENLTKAGDYETKKEIINLNIDGEDMSPLMCCLPSLSHFFSEEGKEELLQKAAGVIDGKFPRKETKKLEKKGAKIDSRMPILLIQYDIGFVFLLLFSALTYPFESAGRYPDEKQKVCIEDYKEVKLLKYMEEILILLKRYTAWLESSIPEFSSLMCL